MQEGRQISSKAGKDPFKGEKRQIQVRRNRASKQVTAATFPATLGAIKYKHINGFFMKKWVYPDDFQKMYEGVTKSYKLIKRAPRIDTTKSEDIQMQQILSNIKSLLPKEANVIIQEDYKDNWCLNIYREANWNYGWSCFAVGKVLKVLSREDDFLHETFLSFLKSFSKSTGVDLWYYGLMGEQIDNLEERMINRDDEGDEVEREYLRAIYEYRHGKAAMYEKFLKNQDSPTDPNQFIELLEDYKKHPIAQIIRHGVELIKTGKRVTDYQMFHQDKNESCYLPFDFGFCIAWSLTDALATETEECLDSYSMEGVEEPHQYLMLNGKKKTDLKGFESKDSFVEDLQDFFNQTYKTLNKIKKYAE